MPGSYVVAIIVFNGVRGEVIVHFIDIDGIVEHHSLNILFIITSKIH
jgi:hypothetical protein